MKLITACLLGLLAADVYALDCWGYMNKPKAIREACMAEANAKLNKPQPAEQRELDARNREAALNRLSEERAYLSEKESKRTAERLTAEQAREARARAEQEQARRLYEAQLREREILAQQQLAAEVAAAAEAARVAAANAAKASAASSAPRTLRCVNGWCQ